MSVADDDTMQSDERGNLERVREILFGARSRDVDQRVARLESRLASEMSLVREELRRRFAELETHVRGEIEALAGRLDEEATARVDAATTLEQRVNRVDESSARGQRDLRRQILDMTRELGSQINRAREELFAALDQGGAPKSEPEAVSSEQAERPSLH